MEIHQLSKYRSTIFPAPRPDLHPQVVAVVAEAVAVEAALFPLRLPGYKRSFSLQRIKTYYFTKSGTGFPLFFLGHTTRHPGFAHLLFISVETIGAK